MTSLSADRKEEVDDVVKVERKGNSEETRQDRRHAFRMLKTSVSCW